MQMQMQTQTQMHQRRQNSKNPTVQRQHEGCLPIMKDCEYGDLVEVGWRLPTFGPPVPQVLLMLLQLILVCASSAKSIGRSTTAAARAVMMK